MADCGRAEPYHSNLQEEYLRLCSCDSGKYCWIQFSSLTLDNSDTPIEMSHFMVGFVFVDVDVCSVWQKAEVEKSSFVVSLD